jgi:branched-chain amino acid transport system permease protein
MSVLPTGLGVAALILVALFLTDQYYLSLASFVVVYGILCLGLVILFGFSGQISVAQAGFYGVGGYIAGLLTTRSGLPPWLALVCAPIGAALLGYVLSWPMLRLRHFYLALGTLAIGQMLVIFFTQAESLTGGTLGVIAIPAFSIGPLDFSDPSDFFGFSALVLVVVFALCRWMERSAFGHALHATRNSEVGAAMAGVNVRQAKTLAFTVAAALAGLAGGLYAFQVSFISPETFSVSFGITILTMVIIGGARSLWGGLLGALFLTALPELLSDYADVSVLIYGLALVLAVMFLPEGLIGLLRAAAELVARRLVDAPTAGARQVDVTVMSQRLAPMLDHTLPGPGRGTDGIALSVEGLSHTFGGLQVLDDVHFRVPEGGVTALIGPNGAGKTTLMNAISGVIPPRVGTVRLHGEDITGIAPHLLARRGLGRTFQALNLYRDRTVRENVVVAAAARRGLDGEQRRGRTRRQQERAVEVLAGVGLGELADVRVDELSFATQRWTDVARALALRPSVLLMDEPASGLGTDEVRALRDLIQELRSHHLTIVLVEHNIDFVLGVADHVVVLEEGRVIFDGAPDAARTDPGVLEAYLGSRWLELTGSEREVSS